MINHGVTSEELPSAETQLKVAEYTIFDREGKKLPFRDIYNGPNATQRTLVIFVRHFFCGSCQQYLQCLSDTITPEVLSHTPISTSIVIVGCGEHGLIDFYAKESRCPFPIYCDPTRKLYDTLRMVKTWDLGPQPDYISKSVFRLAIEGIWSGLSYLPRGLTLKAGPAELQGGELLFESSGQGDEKRIIWCHRMQSSWGHTEIPVLSKIVLDQELPLASTGTTSV